MARLAIYEHLFELNSGFEQVRRAIESLSTIDKIDKRELHRLGAWSEEVRASTNSYLTSVIEQTETEMAGRLYRRRLARERTEESD